MLDKVNSAAAGGTPSRSEERAPLEGTPQAIGSCCLEVKVPASALKEVQAQDWLVSTILSHRKLMLGFQDVHEVYRSLNQQNYLEEALDSLAEQHVSLLNLFYPRFSLTKFVLGCTSTGSELRKSQSSLRFWMNQTAKCQLPKSAARPWIN